MTKKTKKNQWAEKLILLGVTLGLLILPWKDVFLAEAQEQTEVSDEDIVRQHKTNRFMDRIKTEIYSSESDLVSINRQISETSEKVKTTQDKIGTLKDQIGNLEGQIQSSEDIIENVEKQIAKKQSEIETLEYQIAQKVTEISFQKQMISEYLKVIFVDQAGINTLDENGSELNTLKLLLSSDSTSEKLRSLRYSEVLEEQGRQIFEKLGDLMAEQENDQKVMEVKKHTLIILHTKLTEEKQELEVKKQAKENLLEETKGEEEIYQQLLQRSKTEQEDVLLEIETLRKNMAFVQDRMKQLGDNFNPDDYASLLNVGNNKLLLDYLTSGDENSEFAPIWPVNPGRGVSAYFREASYAKVFGMQHNAVDIRAYQNTPIKAVADGVVYKAKDNGYGYSYIMLAHEGGFMTLYGHVTKILVNEGDTIKTGDIIGLSGATPCTKGAGLYTTGPHLHFEVLKNGKHVDPLNYLNLAYLDFDSLPDKYVDKALGDRKKVRRKPVKVRNNSNVQEVDLENLTEPIEN